MTILTQVHFFFPTDEHVSPGIVTQSGGTVGLWIVSGDKGVRPHREYLYTRGPACKEFR